MVKTANNISAELLEEIVEAFNRRDADAIAQYFADDGLFLLARGAEPFGGKITGPAAIRKYIADRFRQIPDMRWVNSQSWTSGNRGVSEWTVMGTAATGEKINWLGCDLWEFADGKIKKKDTYWKWIQPA